MNDASFTRLKGASLCKYTVCYIAAAGRQLGEWPDEIRGRRKKEEEPPQNDISTTKPSVHPTE